MFGESRTTAISVTPWRVADAERERLVVPRVPQHRVEELPRLDVFAGAQPFAHERHPRHRLVDRDDVVRPELLEREQRGHDLRRRGDLATLMRPERPQYA